MTDFGNKKKDKFLSQIPCASLNEESDKITGRCKFNFHYMDFSQSSGQKFGEWTREQLTKLLEKLKNYSGESLQYWKKQMQRTGKNSHAVLEIYGSFPNKSDFQHPKHVPHQAQWARFRLENRVRLIGFVIPSQYENKVHANTGKKYDCNTFYVVFLDRDHRFYKTS